MHKVGVRVEMSRRVCKDDTCGKLTSRLNKVLYVGMQAHEEKRILEERDLYEVDTDDEAKEGRPGSHTYREMLRNNIVKRRKEEKDEAQRKADAEDELRRKFPRSMQMMADAWYIQHIENDIYNIISHSKENDWNYPTKKSEPLTRQRILHHLAANNFHHKGGHHRDDLPMIFHLSGNSWPYGSPDKLKEWTEYAEKNLFDIKGGMPDQNGKPGGYKNVKDNPIVIHRNNKTYMGQILFLHAFKAEIKIKAPDEEQWRRFIRNPETGNWDLPIYIDNTVDWEWVTVDT